MVTPGGDISSQQRREPVCDLPDVWVGQEQIHTPELFGLKHMPFGGLWQVLIGLLRRLMTPSDW